MKKKYVTPMIAVEHYELTQTIAACKIKIGFLDSQCVLSDPDSTNGMKSFADQFSYFVQCGTTVKAGDESSDGVCYHTNLNAAFSS